MNLQRITGLLLMLAIIAAAGCEKNDSKNIELNLGSLLGDQNSQGFDKALTPREFRFPEDHGMHRGFRNEWWYLTGNIEDESGRSFGYQVTFFRTAISPTESDDSDRRSKWKIDDIWMAHAALTDIREHKHLAVERFSRANPGLAGAQINPVKIWLDDWKLEKKPGSSLWQLKVKTADFELEFDLEPIKALVLQGNKGLSQKSENAGNASYYYSYTRIETHGQLRIENENLTITGLSWFDREWSTSALAKNQIGWNWFSLQLDSGEDLMYYQLLDTSGNSDSYSQGKWIDSSGKDYQIDSRDLHLKVLKNWRGNDGQLYPIHWQIDYPSKNKSWIVEAILEDQFMDLAVKYWEGAVVIYNRETSEQVGRGYLEMTRTKKIDPENTIE